MTSQSPISPKARENKSFFGLTLDINLKSRDTQSCSCLHAIDLRSDDVEHRLDIEENVLELYDIVILPGVIRPMALGFKTEEIRRALSMGQSQSWPGRPSSSR